MVEDEAEFDASVKLVLGAFRRNHGAICDGERIPVSKRMRETKEKTYDYYGASEVIDEIDGYLFNKPMPLMGSART